MELANGEIREGVLLIRATDAEQVKIEISSFRADPLLRVVIIDIGVQKSPAAFDRQLCDLIVNFPVPVIAAAEGLIKGWTLGVVLESHICYAAETAVFDFDGCGTGRWSACIDNNRRPDGVVLTATQMIALGELNGPRNPNRAITQAAGTAYRISQMAPLAIRACLGAAKCYQKDPIEKGLATEALLFSELFETEDMRRGTAAFLQKPEPVFEGN